MYCANCGVSIPDTAKFCVECGARCDEHSQPPMPSPSMELREPRKGRGLILAGAALAFVVLLATAGYLHVQYTAKAQIDHAILNIEKYVGLTYGAISADLIRRTITVSDIKVTSIDGRTIEGVSLDKLILGTSATLRVDPGAVDAQAVKLQIDLASWGPEFAPMVGMGYGALTVDSRLKYRYSQERGDFDLDHLEVVVRDFLSLRLALHLGEIKADADGGGLPTAGAATTIKSAQFIVKDAVIIDRLIRWDAAKRGVTTTEYKERVAEGLTEMIQKSRDDAERRALATILDLIEMPARGFMVSMTPNRPVTFDAIKTVAMQKKDPLKLAAMLNFRLE